MVQLRSFRPSAAETRRRVRQASTTYERAADWVVERFSPRQANIRRHRRLMERDADYRDNWLQLLEFRGYKSATSPTNATPWLHATHRSADAEIIQDLATLRARNRQLERDDALAAGVIATKRRQVVGSGLRPQAATKAGDDLNARLEEIWEERKDTLFPGEGDLSFGAGQRLIYTRKIVDGEVLLSRTKATPSEPVWFEIIEAERLDTPLDAKPAVSGGRIVAGVDKDQWGRVQRYWISKWHPGEVVVAQQVGARPRPVALTEADFTAVPKDRIRHLRHGVLRAGQTRGVPLLTPTLQDFLDLDLLTVSLLKRTQVAACLALFIESEQDIADIFNVTAEDYGYQLDQQIEPGMIFKLLPGEKIAEVTPNFTTPDVDPLQKGIARRIGAAAEMSPNAVLRDWNVNYSGARTIQIEDNRAYDVDRHDFAEQGLTWMWEQVMIDAQLRADRRVKGVDPMEFKRVRWVGDARPWVDPQSEAAAVQTRIDLGLTTRRDEAEAQGKDWEELAEQASIEKEKIKELGLDEEYEALKLEVAEAQAKAKEATAKDQNPMPQPERASDHLAAAEKLVRAAREAERPLTLMIDSRSTVAPGAVQIAEGAVKVEEHVDARTTVADGAVQIREGAVKVEPKIDARTEVAPGAVQVAEGAIVASVDARGGPVSVAVDARKTSAKKVVSFETDRDGNVTSAEIETKE